MNSDFSSIQEATPVAELSATNHERDKVIECYMAWIDATNAETESKQIERRNSGILAVETPKKRNFLAAASAGPKRSRGHKETTPAKRSRASGRENDGLEPDAENNGSGRQPRAPMQPPNQKARARCNPLRRDEDYEPESTPTLGSGRATRPERKKLAVLSARSRKRKQKRGSWKNNAMQAETQDSSRQEINKPTPARRAKIN
jgi:hypothetical protein